MKDYGQELSGPIGYIEHRSPMKDEGGRYLIHPQFVYTGCVWFQENMRDGMRQHYQNGYSSSFWQPSSLSRMRRWWHFSSGMEVKIGDMFIIKPKLKLRDHKDDDGNIYHKVYHEGELIPANEVVIEGFEVKTTREFDKEFFCQLWWNCRFIIPWKVSFPPKEFGSGNYWTSPTSAKSMAAYHGRYFMPSSMVLPVSCPKVLSGYCEGQVPEDDSWAWRQNRSIYRRIGVWKMIIICRRIGG